jgi:uncharacterized membrane protein
MIFHAVQSSLLPALKMLTYVLHIGGGTLGLLSGMVAVFAHKGAKLHRVAGTVFFVSMLVMSAVAGYLAVAVPGQIVNLFIATFTFYLVATAWMTVRRPEHAIGIPEKIALLVILGLCAPFAVLSFQLATGLPPIVRSSIPLEGPVLIAIYGFTTVIAIAAISDAKVALAGGIAGAPRIARHLWRMCLALMLATGSFFTNALPRLLPPPMHVSLAFFLPQFLPLGLLIFWMIRLRYTGWLKLQKSAS